MRRVVRVVSTAVGVEGVEQVEERGVEEGDEIGEYERLRHPQRILLQILDEGGPGVGGARGRRGPGLPVARPSAQRPTHL